jgi:hypothetical protein
LALRGFATGTKGLDAVLGQRFDVVELGEAAVGESWRGRVPYRPARGTASAMPATSRNWDKNAINTRMP